MLISSNRVTLGQGSHHSSHSGLLTKHLCCLCGQGSTALAALVRQAQGRISVMAGGGVRPKNAESLIRLTGVSEVHSACARSAAPPAEMLSCMRLGEN